MPRPYAFPKSAHLRTANDFRLVRAARRSAKNDVLRISWRANELGATRFGTIVPIRGVGAVLRNRIKRVLREVFRLKRATLPAGFDLVASPIDAPKVADFDACSAAFDALIADLRRREKRA